VVEVERIVPGDGAVEAGLEVGRPAVLELLGATFVVLADPRHARVHALHRNTHDNRGQYQREGVN
jgi:hypothetical protein